MKRVLLLILALVLVRCWMYGQPIDSTRHTAFPTGLTLQAGLGSYAIRDEFISHERYSGRMPLYSLQWTDGTPGRVSRITLEYEAGSGIKNYNVSGSITEFTFGLDYLYPIGRWPFLSHNVSAYFGPSPDLFFHFRSQNIASGGSALARAYSVAILLSAGATLEIVCPIDNAFLADASLSSSVLSFGARFVNPDESDQSFVKPLTSFSGLRFKSNLGVRYIISSNFSARIGYRFEFTRITAWDFFISGCDMGVLSVQYGF
jgi:hypothetical protein